MRFWLSCPRLFNGLVRPGFSLVNARTYGIYIPRVFVPSRFLRRSWLSTFATDVSRGHSSLGKPPAIKN